MRADVREAQTDRRAWVSATGADGEGRPDRMVDTSVLSQLTRKSGVGAVVLGLAATLAVCGACGSGSSAPPPGTSAPITLADRTTAPAPADRAAPNHDLYIHCGVKYAIFDGDNWVTDASVVFPDFTTDPVTGISTSRASIRGTMVRTSATRAEFTTTDQPRGVRVVFEVTKAPIPPCA